MAEVWKAVPGYEGAYEVSDQGRVRSLDRSVLVNSGKGPNRSYWKQLSGQIIAPQKHTQGYLQVALSGHIFLVQWLVAATFIGSRPDGCLILHNDGDKQNNRLNNLRYDTPVENCIDMVAHGTTQFGELNPRAKLRHRDIHAIRRQAKAGVHQRDIADMHGISQTQVSRIVNNFRWRHV